MKLNTNGFVIDAVGKNVAVSVRGDDARPVAEAVRETLSVVESGEMSSQTLAVVTPDMALVIARHLIEAAQEAMRK
jgi:hypothetical protein